MPSVDTDDSSMARTSIDLHRLRVAIVHHWFVKPWGGAERVVEAIARIFPQADLFAMIADPEVLPPDLKRRRLQTSFLQRIPGRYRLHRHLMPLYPLALEQLDLRGYDLVISSESAPAKGVITASSTCHICYCHSPMRYIWDLYHDYRTASGLGMIGRTSFMLASHYLRMWDVATANRVDYFVANSENVARRIRKHYRRDAAVVHSAVRVADAFVASKVEDYYLVLGRLVDYKRADLAVEACNGLGRKLKVIGGGPQIAALKKVASPNLEFLGFASDDVVKQALAHCRALLFPGEEDFGIVPVEAQSYGRPVIAFGRGGALETVKGVFPGDTVTSETTGVFFAEPSVESLAGAIRYFESVEKRFVPAAIRQHAQQFDEKHFCERFLAFVRDSVEEFSSHSRKRSDTYTYV